MRVEKKSYLLWRFSLPSISILLLVLAAVGAKAQSGAVEAQPNPASAQPVPASTQPFSLPGPSVEEIQKRVDRARALAAAHQLEAAASELETARAKTTDAALRDGTSVMLMGIYLEAANYTRAQSLLEETFQARSGGKDGSIGSYFALAGQAVNGLRLHLARYLSFGVSIGSPTLPPEAVHDLDRLRSMVERMVAQAREITKDAPQGNDGLALLEDVLGVRASLARDSEDRDKWHAEYAEAREQLGSGRIKIASTRGAPPLVRTSQNPPKSTVEASTDQNVTSQPAETGDNSTHPPPLNAGSLNERARKRVVPVYPQIAKNNRTEGVVRVYVIVDETGEVQVTKSEGPMLLRQSAEDAARGWRFPPFIVDNKPIRLAGYIEFTFAL